MAKRMRERERERERKRQRLLVSILSCSTSNISFNGMCFEGHRKCGFVVRGS